MLGGVTLFVRLRCVGGLSVLAVATSAGGWIRLGAVVGEARKGRVSDGKTIHGRLTYGSTKSVELSSSALITSKSTSSTLPSASV